MKKEVNRNNYCSPKVGQIKDLKMHQNFHFRCINIICMRENFHICAQKPVLNVLLKISGIQK